MQISKLFIYLFVLLFVFSIVSSQTITGVSYTPFQYYSGNNLTIAGTSFGTNAADVSVKLAGTSATGSTSAFCLISEISDVQIICYFNGTLLPTPRNSVLNKYSITVTVLQTPINNSTVIFSYAAGGTLIKATLDRYIVSVTGNNFLPYSKYYFTYRSSKFYPTNESTSTLLVGYPPKSFTTATGKVLYIQDDVYATISTQVPMLPYIESLSVTTFNVYQQVTLNGYFFMVNTDNTNTTILVNNGANTYTGSITSKVDSTAVVTLDLGFTSPQNLSIVTLMGTSNQINYVYASPNISGISQNLDALEITGTNFGFDPLLVQVTLGANNLTYIDGSLTDNSNMNVSLTQIIKVTLPQVYSSGTITLIANGQSSNTKELNPNPTISSVFPSSIKLSTETTFTISGTEFSSLHTVKIRDEDCLVQASSTSTELYCKLTTPSQFDTESVDWEVDIIFGGNNVVESTTATFEVVCENTCVECTLGVCQDDTSNTTSTSTTTTTTTTTGTTAPSTSSSSSTDDVNSGIILSGQFSVLFFGLVTLITILF
ncbi:hypothetical protein DLAC_00926 [Tieghemostelium lacteum]|uniref:IPT/TIG domain-containing protein n=1 Tax=Tieghemostelium lacteum TaxID=361077 RepID=A0A152A7F2_TIELA|nr:hypothetical protein DLAC_00926 [Tieghemostelium lacteum]|eukprot:KYR02126.1 hypothetical protein DLAC_00926 [Tieghemostelium lacteum]